MRLHRRELAGLLLAAPFTIKSVLSAAVGFTTVAVIVQVGLGQGHVVIKS